MNRLERRAQQKIVCDNVKNYPDKLVLIPPDEWPPSETLPDAVWLSKQYLVQAYTDYRTDYPGLLRLSICRTTINKAMSWNDGLTWDDLQIVKRECGYGDSYAIEVYPKDSDIVNVANMRHLWVFDEPLSVGWFK